MVVLIGRASSTQLQRHEEWLAFLAKASCGIQEFAFKFAVEQSLQQSDRIGAISQYLPDDLTHLVTEVVEGDPRRGPSCVITAVGEDDCPRLVRLFSKASEELRDRHLDHLRPTRGVRSDRRSHCSTEEHLCFVPRGLAAETSRTRLG
jgi:hypothetical protein